jgi:hypothetical protein
MASNDESGQSVLGQEAEAVGLPASQSIELETPACSCSVAI